MIVVIPSNRSVNLDYLEPLIEDGARFIVVDDSPGSVVVNHPQFQIYNWNDRKRILGEYDQWFPRKNGVCRDFGFYLAWRDADEDEVVVALDDDCEVTDSDFGKHVEDALSERRLPSIGSGFKHANIIECYEDMPDNLFPRGFPYEARINHKPWVSGPEVVVTPNFNLGLWTDAYDVNAIDKISGPTWRYPDAKLRFQQLIVPNGTLVSACSMNMQFRVGVSPAVYQFPMNIPVMDGWVVDRYGDIWGGFLLKLLLDANDDVMTVGAPMIGHRKAGDMTRNIWQEHIGHLVNIEMIELLSECATEVRSGSYLDGMADLLEGLQRRYASVTPLLKPYLDHLVPSITAWINALREAKPNQDSRLNYQTSINAQDG